MVEGPDPSRPRSNTPATPPQRESSFPDANRHRPQELGFDATADEIKKAYRKLSLMYHPDKAAQVSIRAQIFVGSLPRPVLTGPVLAE